MLQEFQQVGLPRIVLEEVLFTFVLTWGVRLAKAVLILILARLALRFGNSLIQKIFTPVPDRPAYLPENKAKTLSALLTSVWRYLIWALAIVLVITELDIMDIGPILAGAGIVGLAVGFGAQNLVRDIISGFFIILEDQFSVGDYITTGTFSGIVEELGLRITKIRDFSGELHIVPNGYIEAVTNRTRGNMRAMVDVTVAYEEEVEAVLSVLEEAVRQYALADPDIVEGPTVLGVVELAEAGVVIRIIARTVPMTQWKVERGLRRAVKSVLDKHGIEIPYPRRVVFTRGCGKEAGNGNA